MIRSVMPGVPRAIRIRPDPPPRPAAGFATSRPGEGEGEGSVRIDAGDDQVLSGTGGTSVSPIRVGEAAGDAAAPAETAASETGTPAPADGYVSVSVDVRGARVTLDGHEVQGPPYDVSIRPGSYRLEVSAAGHATHRGSLVVASGLVTTAVVQMTPISAAPRPTDLATRAPGPPPAAPQQRRQGLGTGGKLLLSAALIGAGFAAWKLGLSTDG